ncbi:MAG TPA: rhomboid family intramembrane serine protease [Candidatus Sulfotelmatobacter sp.]
MANCIRCGRKLSGFSFKKICQWCVYHEAVQRGETPENAPQPVMAVPWVGRGEATITLTQVLFGANLAVFLAMAFASSSIIEFPGHVLYWGANVGPYTLSGQWWRLVTYMFMHGGLMHIAFNMWCLWDLGALSESLYGRWTFGAIYLITGVGGGLASVAWNPQVLTVGASGAIFGLCGALIASFYLGEFSLPRAAIQGVLKSLVVFAGFNLFFGSMFPGIDNACHIGGLITGLILGAMVARLAADPAAIARRVSVLGVAVLVLLTGAVGVQRWRGPAISFGRSSLYSQRNLNEIIAELQKKTRQSPQDASAHSALANAYFANRQFPEGLAELKRVVELQPQNSAAQMNLGAAYLNEAQPKEAQETFTRLLAQEPNNARAHVGLGMALAEQQNHQPAIDEYTTALRLDSQLRGVYYQMGVSQAELKHYDDAIASYFKEQKTSGDSYRIENALADAYQTKGMQQQAQDARNKAARLRGDEND